MALGAAATYFLISHAVGEIGEAAVGKRPLLDTQMFWYIIIPVFLPIIAGLCLFGWYAWKGEYDAIPRDSEQF